MAGAIGRLTAAIASVHNENSAALATLNFDFTIVKLDAPAEYNGLGATISRKRKKDAEKGALHKTARRLGALFGELLPPSEELFRAYGTRVSEISSLAHINPQGSSEKAGIFASHIGADTTSIWAAVTSGSAAIAIHLLACMLARTFSVPEAISAWVEIVERRKVIIQDQQQSGLYSNEYQAAVFAAEQDISRTDLANWDASARAWLQSADEAKKFQHKQITLILQNASLPVNNENDTYSSVTKAWISALEAMNSLLKGIPQRVQDGTALVAISSWHLYPDMKVYGTSCVEVKQSDPLFKRSAFLTIGLEQTRHETKSVYWSLPLTCLQYYGHPVQANRSLGRENSRVSSDGFAYIILGCVFDSWKTYATTNEDGIQWILVLANILGLVDEDLAKELMGKRAWLAYLLSAVRKLSKVDESEQKVARQLMSLGRRRSSYIYRQNGPPQPLLGISEFQVLIPLLEDEEERVRFLRRLSSNLKLSRTAFIINYKLSGELFKRTEYASTCRINRSMKRTHDGETKNGDDSCRYVRWLFMSAYELAGFFRRLPFVNSIAQAKERLAKLRKQEAIEAAAFRQEQAETQKDVTNKYREPSSTIVEIRELQTLIHVEERRKAIQDKGELCFPVGGITRKPYGESLTDGLVFSMEGDFFQAAGDILRRLSNPASPRVSRTFFVGDANTEALYFIPNGGPLYLDGTWNANASITATPEFLREVLPNCVFDKEKLDYYFSESLASEASICGKSQVAVQDQIQALHVCATMTELYELLPGASISTLVLNESLFLARWIRKARYMEPWQALSKRKLTLPQAFACIAMFESGTCNLDPKSLEEVFAMSSGNSIYIAGSLLCDPIEKLSAAEVRRVIGNLGRPGITLLIAPPDLKSRESDTQTWKSVNHNVFDGTLENHFQKTSIHLSFTRYELPLVTENTARHLIDRVVNFVETLVSVYDGGL